MARAFKDSGVLWIGEIPDDWEIVKTRRVFSIGNGHDPITTGNTPVYGSGFEPFKSCGEFKEGPAVLVARKGSIGNVNYVVGNYWNVDTAFDVKPLDENSILLKFYYYAAGLFDYGNYRTQTTIPSMNKHDYLQFYLPKPSIRLQRVIVTYLDAKCAEIDSAVASAEASIEEYKAYRKSVIFNAVTKGLDDAAPMRDSGVEWIGEVPAHWDVDRIGSLFKWRSEKVSDEEYQPLSVTKQGVLPQLSYVAKSDNHTNRKLVKAGDFAINSRSDRRNSCGFARQDGSVSTITTVLKPRIDIDIDYYEMLFDTSEFADEFYANGHGIVADLWTTGWDEMKRILIPSPPLAEQHKVANYLNIKCAAIQQVIDSKQSIIEELKAYKKSLIFEVVTGKKEV